MKRFSLVFPLIGLLLAGCGPVEPEPEDSGATFSRESVGQWEPDLHDTRLIAERGALMEINQTLLTMPGTGALLAEYAFGDGQPTETFRYIDLTRGFAVDLPYDDTWSTGTYVLPPFELYDEVSELRFGPLLSHAQNGYGRAYTLRYVPMRSPEAARQAYEQELEVGEEDVRLEQTGSGAAVVVTNVRSDCPSPVIEVPGSRFNYVFTASCEAVSRWPDVLERLWATASTLRTQ